MHKHMSPHGDADHMGEAINLINNFKVEKVIFNCGEYNELTENEKRLYRKNQTRKGNYNLNQTAAKLKRE